MESYLEDDRRFHSPESKKSKLHGLEGLYLHSTPVSQSNPHQFHPLSLSFNGLKDMSNTEKITPLYSPLTDEGYSSVGSSSTPTGMLNNMPTFELFNHYKDYSHPACIHNPSNQREKLEIVALELLNQARLIPHPACFGRPVNRDILSNCEENMRSQVNANNFQFLGGFNDKCQLLSQPDMRFGNFNHPSVANGSNEYAHLSQYNSFYPRPVPSVTTNISQNLYRQHLSEQLKHHRQFENSTRVDNDATNNDNSPQSPERRSRMCNQILSQVRREMIKLIDNSMQQLETYLQNNHFEDTNTSSNFLDYCNSLKSVQVNFPEDLNVTPLNLKFSKSNITAESASDANSMPGEDLRNEEDFNPNNRVSSELKLSNSSCRTTPTKDSPTDSSRTRQLRLANKTRRLRIHQFNSQLFVNKNEVKKSNTQSPIDNKRQIHSDEKEVPNKIPHLDESLDLRIHHEAADDDKSQSEVAISSHNLQNNYSHTRLKRSILSNHTRTTTLSAVHLKKAKMMFMYSRYPTSSLLKSYFPEVIFNRGSTAQLVKWFSNFREFFYIQIEKFVRQQKAAGLKKADDIMLSREHELIRSMEMHFNKGDEIETPKEFLDAIQITVWEFADAVLNSRDANPAWKKSIYKKISMLDVQFPEFFRC
uniref:Prospero domain-containing protein n=1 Tax=Trichobilharzia regenti TaxID=157069 RepID=A0AA85K1A4_TRIRE|nr:unnamed protein product [Trichobilharzia regenti]